MKNRKMLYGIKKYLIIQKIIKSDSNNSDLNNYKNSTLGFSVLESRGARCFRRKVNSLVRKNFSINASSIFSNIPTGGQCDGYPNSKNGYYYETVDKKDLPIYATYVEGEERTERFPIPNQFSNNKLLKVCIIRNEEWQADFYFIEIESKLYFFCQDLCGCSA